jgi:DNA replication protein DnaC
MGWVLKRRPGHDPVAEPCHCRESLDQYQHRVLLTMSGLSREEYERKRLSTFDVSYHPDCPAMLVAATQWITMTPPWLVFIGDNGIGKTHLAMAVVAELVDQGKICRYIPWYDLMAQLRSSIRSQGGDADAGMDLILSELSDVPFLVVDEITEEECRTPFQTGALTSLMDRRYRKRWPTLIATNLSPAELAERSKRTADRARDQSLCRLFIAEEAFSVRPMLGAGT